jgi:tRNA (cmo5U34)-methyltransferase
MINRSVPGYSTILKFSGELARRYAQNNSNCYDLGCSLGGTLFSIQQHLDTPNVKLIGIDNSADMLNRCKTLLEHHKNQHEVELRCEDITQSPIENASVCCLNFTLQFVAKEKRQQLLSSINKGMLENGVLILSEKLSFEDEDYNQLMVDLHHNFKRMNGYSDLEIAQKRDAIENVLIPETYATHHQRLLDCGFKKVELWFQCFNFASIVAFK